ncbi:PREDICTED: F-box/kelch-repeat protein At3g23880-like [Fragaria vesca subsp. vesca]|uniref:F-box/kelch-repeat protein At3g23880-like n=1 Tax=Fragaria vesca subsp. vesca TaxID=101020 RepID=UPI0002C3702C|nr:PREDICTED: F-box/kelch-repeat protein At3g23880-like [Fragaria vesca subsp. vesca]
MPTIKLPDELLDYVFARLPVKSAVVLTCVCKSFKTLITSSRFIHLHRERNMKTASNYLLVRSAASTEIGSMSRICARTFAGESDIQLLEDAEREFRFELPVYGSYDGLLCLSSMNLFVDTPIYLWNPSMRKVRRLPHGLIPSTSGTVHNRHGYRVTLGFGFHFDIDGGNDYKVIKFLRHATDSGNAFKLEVYSLNLNSWKTVSRVPHVPKNATFRPKCACLNGVVYWLLNDVRFTIVSFDMRHESFQIRRFSCDFYPVMYPNCMQALNNSLSLFRVRHVGEMRYRDVYILNMKQSRLDLSRTLRMEWTSIAWSLGFNTGGRGQGIDVIIRTDTQVQDLFH